MEKCPSCGRKSLLYKLAFMPRGVCGACFCENIIRRVRREIRLGCQLFKGDVVVLADDGSINARVLEFILRDLQRDFPFQIAAKAGKTKAKPALPWTLDDSVAKRLKPVLFGGKGAGGVFAPLRVVHRDEVEVFAKIQGLKGGKTCRLDAKERAILDSLKPLEKKHPQLKFSVQRFFSKNPPEFLGKLS